MPALFAKCTNDIVSLTVLALMVLALVAGQAGAKARPVQNADVDAPAAHVIAIGQEISLRSKGEKTS